MSRSPERISSYRRHFEDSSCSTSTYQVRVSSPSPTRRETRHGSTGYSSRAAASSMRMDSVGRRTISAARRSRMVGTGVAAGAMVCVGPSGEPAIDLEVAAAENQEFLSTRTSERQEMVVLNDRLAVYIDKVRSLEQQNKLLEAEIEAYQNRFEKPTGLRLLYEEQLRELKKIAEQMRVQRDISLAAKGSAAAQLEAIKIQYEEAVELRKKAELEIEAFRPDVDKATASRIALEKKLEQLQVEIEFLKRIHQQEIEELMKQIYAAHASAQSAFALPDLGAALKQIQNQYDDIAAKNLQDMDSWYKNKFEDITKKTSGHLDKVRGIREEIGSAKKNIQNKERDLDSQRTKNEALEAQIRETQEKYRKELEDLQARIEALQLEMKSTKEKIALHLREYQELLNVKMSLEIEITTYRKLIEGEDLRLAGMMQTLSLTSCSMSAIGGGMSFSGGGIGGVSGMGGGLIEGSSGGIGGMRSGLGTGGGIAAGLDTGGLGGRMGPAGIVGGADMAGSGAGGIGLGVGAQAGGVGAAGGGVGASTWGSGDASPGSGIGGVATSGVGKDVGGVGTAVGGIGAGGVAVGGASTVTGGMGNGVGGVGTAVGGIGAGGVAVGGASTVTGGVGNGVGGVGTGGVGAGVGRIGTGATGVGAGVVGDLGSGIGRVGDSSVRRGLGSDATGSGGIGEDKGNGVGGDGGKIYGTGPGGHPGIGGAEGVGGDDLGVALSGTGGMEKKGAGKSDKSGDGIGYGSDGYDGNIEAYAEQAVELTERRTVLIRTVKTENDVLEMDHQEQTYTISGAADDSDDE